MPHVKGVRVNLRIAEAVRRLLDDDTKLYAHQRYYDYMYEYLPFVTGNLANTVDISPEGVRFQAQAENGFHYAAVHWDGVSKSGKPFKRNLRKHPLASSRWGEAAMTRYGEDLNADITEYIKYKARHGG